MTSIPDTTAPAAAPEAASAPLPGAGPRVYTVPGTSTPADEPSGGPITDRLRPLAQQAEGLLEQRPLTGLLVAAGVGAVLGWLIKR